MRLFELKTIARIENAEINGVVKHKFDDFATKEDKEIAKDAADWDIPDEELFE